MRLLRGDGPVIRVGHRGAAALAPGEHAARLRGGGRRRCRRDRVRRPRPAGGPLVLAHSDDLHEVSHGAADGRVRDHVARRAAGAGAGAADARRGARVAGAARDVAAHVDLKLTTRLDELVAARSSAMAWASGRSSAASTCRACSSCARLAPRVAARPHLPGGSLRRLAAAGAAAGDPRRDGRAAALARPARAGHARASTGAGADAAPRGRLAAGRRARPRGTGRPCGPGRWTIRSRPSGRSCRRGRGDHERSGDARGYTRRVRRGGLVALFFLACAAAGLLSARSSRRRRSPASAPPARPTPGRPGRRRHRRRPPRRPRRRRPRAAAAAASAPPPPSGRTRRPRSRSGWPSAARSSAASRPRRRARRCRRVPPAAVVCSSTRGSSR